MTYSILAWYSRAEIGTMRVAITAMGIMARNEVNANSSTQK